MKLMMPAPALANCGTMASTGFTIRCTSSGTETWPSAAHERADGQVRHVVVIHDIEVNQVGAGALARTSSPSRAKSADRMLGAMRNVMAARVYNARVAQEKLYDIAVNTATEYLADQSDESAGRYVFAYTITIQNMGALAAQLISRHWIITDAQGLVQEVRGLGVVGAQPLLQPGERFEYTSGASIATPVGTMRGSYQMVATDGTRFEAPIPAFTFGAAHPALSHFFLRGQVNQTMKAARARASNTSR